MNIKNKILLTIIAIIFAICLFNTNCFATVNYTTEDGIVIEYPIEEPEEYIIFYSFDWTDGRSNEYVLVYPVDNVSSNGFGIRTATKNSDCFVYYNDDNVRGNWNYVSYHIDDGTFETGVNTSGQIALTSKSHNGSTVYSTLNIYNYSDETGFDYTGEVYFNASLERGTDQGNISDNTTGDNDTDSGNTTDSDDSGGILSSIKEGFENVVNFFKELIEGITNIFKTIGDNFLDLFTKLGEWFSDLFEKLGNWFSGLGSSIGGFFSSLWENIKSFFTGVVEFFDNFWTAIWDFFCDIFDYLFVPEENSFTGIIDIVKSKFDFIETIKISANSLKDLISNVGTAPKLTININDNEFGIKKLTIIDLEWYKPYKTYGDLILTGFIYAFFLWRLFITIPNILNGTGGAVQDTYKVSKAIDIDMSDFNKNFKL